MGERPLRFPWRDYQRFCLGVLRWSPSDFWRATVWEVAEAYEGYALSKGIKKQTKTSLTEDDVSELRAWMDEYEHA